MEAESAGSSPPRPRLRTHITSSLFPVAATATTTDAASAADDVPPNEHTGGHSMAPPGLTAFLKQMQQNQMQQAGNQQAAAQAGNRLQENLAEGALGSRQRNFMVGNAYDYAGIRKRQQLQWQQQLHP